jgi:hypothetical protein
MYSLFLPLRFTSQLVAFSHFGVWTVRLCKGECPGAGGIGCPNGVVIGLMAISINDGRSKYVVATNVNGWSAILLFLYLYVCDTVN